MAFAGEGASGAAAGNGDEPQIDGASILARALKEQVKYRCWCVLFDSCMAMQKGLSRRLCMIHFHFETCRQ